MAKFKLKALIFHELKKERQGLATLVLRKSSINVKANHELFISKAKDAYFNKSRPLYGVFDPDITNFPYQTILKSYLDKKIDFLTFTKNAMSILKVEIQKKQQATGGYVCFAHYFVNDSEYLMVSVLHNTKRFKISADLDIAEDFSVEIDKLDVANIVNITRWNNESEDTYLSFVKGKKNVSDYFRYFIGCTEYTDSKKDTEKFKSVFLDYINNELHLEKKIANRLKNDVYNYCLGQIQKREDISIQYISSLINPEEPESFVEFSAEESFQLSPLFQGEKQVLRNLKFVSFDSPELKIEFDTKLITERKIVYDKTKNHLLIKEIPDELKAQLNEN